MKVVFMGTPDFANLCLDALIRADVEVVTSQPNRPKGRGPKSDPHTGRCCRCKCGYPSLSMHARYQESLSTA